MTATRLLRLLSGALAVGGVGLVGIGALDLLGHRSGAAATALTVAVLCLMSALRFLVASRRQITSYETPSEERALRGRGRTVLWKLTWTVVAGAIGVGVGYGVGHDLTGMVVGGILAALLVAFAAFGPMPSDLVARGGNSQ
jgi:hypothetical protein